jgi:arylsulfatase A-like enzyme
MLITKFHQQFLCQPLFYIWLSFIIFTSNARADGKPNIVFIIADDIGWTDWRAYNPRGKIPSPHIDQLAREGIRFTDAHTTSALCAPSRYSLITGNYPWRGLKPGGSWLWFTNPQILPGQQTIADLLNNAGYRTGIIGKLHIGADFVWNGMAVDFSQPMKIGPKEWGFDYSFVTITGHQGPPYAFFENNRIVGDPSNVLQLLKGSDHGAPIPTTGPGLPEWNSKQVSYRLLEKAIKFIQDSDEQPFYLHYSTVGAHSPWTPPEKLFGDPVAGKTGLSAHADMVYEVDVVLGKILTTLKNTGKLDNTIIVLTSDNGGSNVDAPLGHNANLGLKGEKSFIFEGGHRVPLIVRWPGHVPANTVSKQLIGNHDMVATFADIANVQYADNQVLDSISFLPVLLQQQSEEKDLRESLLIDSGLGRDATSEREPNWQEIQHSNANSEFWFQQVKRWIFTKGVAATSPLLGRPDTISDPPTTNEYWKINIKKGVKSGSNGMAHAVREGPWKLVLDIENDAPAALYNLDDDLAEQQNLINDRKQQARIESMEKTYRVIRASKRSVPYSGNRDIDTSTETL